MKPGSILINASRGTVVDIDALHAALTSGHLAGAALDVFPTEPKSVDEPLASPLIGLHNVLLTPHIGGSPPDSQETTGRAVAEKRVRFLQAGPPQRTRQDERPARKDSVRRRRSR